MKIFTAILFVWGSLSLSLKAQETSQVNQQLWLEGMVDNSFGVKWDLWADGSYRQLYSDGTNNWRATIRPNIKYQVLEWLDFRIGLMGMYSYFDESNASLEVRPSEGFAIGWPKIIGIKFVHLVRFEQRFIYDTSDWTYDFSGRIRYQLSTRINLSRTKKYKTFFIPLAAEMFLQSKNEVNDLFRNRARFTVGLGYVFNREITVDAKFMVEQNRSDAMELNITDTIFRLRFRYNLFSFEEDETKL